MAQPDDASIWTTDEPATWPDLPPEMTVTTLVEIESCPRRWALGAAQYPDLWEGRGYPPRIQLSALAGTVVHLALETITKALAKEGCASVQDPAVVQAMKGLGGYTKVVNECINHILGRLTGNPRAKRLLESAARTLRGRVPDLRTRVQTMLCRVRLLRTLPPQSGGNASKERRPLTVGVFSEIVLHASKIGWKGKVDLLVLRPDACEITDFKTGAPDEGHPFQVKVYALLWSRDGELNPSRRRADRLVLAYSTEQIEVAAPDDAELETMEREIVARGAAASRACSRRPPEAQPSAVDCRYCSVRQLCTKYWTPETQHRMTEEVGDKRSVDVEVTIVRRHGPSSWDALVEVSRNLPPKSSIVVRTSGDTDFEIGGRFRLLDTTVSVDSENEEQPAVITLGAVSEVYAVRKP